MSGDVDVKALIAEARQREFYWGRYSEETGSPGLMLSRYEIGLMAAFAGRVADALEAAASAPAVDREALTDLIMDVRDAHPRVMNDAPTDEIVDALLASGILRDVRDVQAETLEEAAGAMPHMSGENLHSRWLRARAQAIREARNER